MGNCRRRRSRACSTPAWPRSTSRAPGGTSWSEVERYRIAEPWRRRVAAAFAGWGIPTARALIEARAVAPSETLIASGGIRSALDVAKALALGADLVGIAGPFLRAADDGLDTALELAREIAETLRIAMFCVGARRPLRAARDAAAVTFDAAAFNLDAADEYCRVLTRRHYENFSVASRFVDAGTRRDLTRIYAYCRTTDDLGDESPYGSALARLERWRSEVDALFARSAAGASGARRAPADDRAAHACRRSRFST